MKISKGSCERCSQQNCLCLAFHGFKNGDAGTLHWSVGVPVAQDSEWSVLITWIVSKQTSKHQLYCKPRNLHELPAILIDRSSATQPSTATSRKQAPWTSSPVNIFAWMTLLLGLGGGQERGGLGDPNGQHDPLDRGRSRSWSSVATWAVETVEVQQMYDVRCKFEAFEVEFNDYLAVEIQLYHYLICSWPGGLRHCL